MIRSFHDRATEDVYHDERSVAARRALPMALWQVARRKLDLLEWSRRLEDLRSPPGNRLEALRGDRAGQHSIRINEQYRICFHWTDSGPESVEITDYH